jgi:hypothetical protein
MTDYDAVKQTIDKSSQNSSVFMYKYLWDKIASTNHPNLYKHYGIRFYKKYLNVGSESPALSCNFPKKLS